MAWIHFGVELIGWWFLAAAGGCLGWWGWFCLFAPPIEPAGKSRPKNAID